MKLTEETYIQVIEDLKNENVQLRKEVAELNAENIRLQEVANNALREEHPEGAIGSLDLSELPDDKDTLKTENEMLKSIIDNLGVGVGISDNNGNILSLNKEALRIHGFQSEESMFSFFKNYTEEFELQYPDGTKMPLEEWPLSRALRRDFVQDYEVKLINIKTSTSRIINYSIIPVYNDVCELMLIVINMADITALKKINLELMESEQRHMSLFNDIHENEQRLNGIFNHAAIGIVEMDTETRFILVNDKICEILGYSRNELLSKSMLEITSPDDKEHSKALYDKLKSGETDILNYEKRYLKKNNQTLWVHVSVSAIRDQQGQHLKSIATIKDISERKKTEQALRESEEQALARAMEIEAILSCIPDGVLVYNTHGKIIRSNQAADNYLRYQQNDLTYNITDRITKYYEVWNEEGRQITPQEMPAFRASLYGEIITNEVLKIKQAEQSRWFIFNAAPLVVSGQHKGGVLSMLDISSRKIMEQRLQESEERFRLLADNISQIAWITDEKGDVLWYNKQWFDYTGVSIEEIKEKGYQIVLHPDYAEQVINSFSNSISKVEPWEEIYPMQSKEGNFRWFLARALPIYDHNGNVVYWFGTNTDITNQRAIEDTLRENEKRLEAIFNNAAIGIVEVNKDNQFVFVNNRTCEILGYSREELLTKTVMEITFPEDREVSDSNFHKFHTGELNILNYEKRYLKRDGMPIWVHVSVSVIRDDRGQHIKSIGTIEDISERKKIENALQESEEMFSTMFQSAPVSISLSKSDDTLYNVNKAWLQLTGYEKEEVLGKRGVDLGMFINAEKSKHILEEFTKNGHVRNAEVTFINKLGIQRVVYLSIDKIYTRGQQFRLSTIEDITEQKEIEKEIKQKNEELTRFIYTVSHDLKSPLVTIKSFASFLVSDLENDDKVSVEKDLGYISNSADKMGRLLDELLELSRIGRKEELKVEVSLREVAEAAIDLVAGRISNGNVQIKFVGPSVILYGYNQRLIQLYQNLIDNAVKFMDNQPNPLVEIGTLIDRDKIVLFVRDNGSGIDPRYHHKIFGLFEKLDTSSEGTGIGLALIKRIIEVHGGTIWFQSEGAGKGTTFYFTLDKAYII